jgi:Na+/proline symporter
MELVPLDLGIIIGYLSVLVVIGLLMRGKASKNILTYFLGGRKIPAWVLGISGAFSNLDLAGTMVISSFFFILGLKGYWIAIRGGLCFYLAFILVIFSKWCRRSKCITMAEWMELRFGKKKDGEAARLIMAIYVLLNVICMIGYAAVAIGKFGNIFLGWEPWICIVVFMSITTIYVVLSGLYGVAYTDVVQACLVIFTCLYIGLIAFKQFNLPLLTEAITTLNPQKSGIIATKEWLSFLPTWKAELPPVYAKKSEYLMYQAFGLCIFTYFYNNVIFGNLSGGGVASYTAQRFLAAKNERESGLTALIWMIPLVVRWFFVGAIALLGMSIGTKLGGVIDPETALPVVIREYLPVGIRGLVIAGLIAASMSTLDSTINGGAAYFVRDIYQKYKRKTTDKELVYVGYLISLAIVIIGGIIGVCTTSIETIWVWIVGTLGAGMAFPFLLRWYWHRFNGWGFAVGSLTGMVGAIIVGLLFPGLPLWIEVPVLLAISFVVTMAATLLARPTDEETLANYYRVTRPFGWWKPIKKLVPKAEWKSVKHENKIDIASLFIALPWQAVLYAMPLFIIIHDWSRFCFSLLIFAALSVALYFVWYKHLAK